MKNIPTIYVELSSYLDQINLLIDTETEVLKNDKNKKPKIFYFKPEKNDLGFGYILFICGVEIVTLFRNMNGDVLYDFIMPSISYHLTAVNYAFDVLELEQAVKQDLSVPESLTIFVEMIQKKYLELVSANK